MSPLQRIRHNNQPESRVLSDQYLRMREVRGLTLDDNMPGMPDHHRFRQIQMGDSLRPTREIRMRSQRMRSERERERMRSERDSEKTPMPNSLWHMPRIGPNDDLEDPEWMDDMWTVGVIGSTRF